MQEVDLQTASVKRTTPQGIHVFDRALIVEPASATPRYGWNRDPVQNLMHHQYRFIVETTFDDSVELGDISSSYTPDNTAYFQVVPMDSITWRSTGTGYRSPYRTLLDDSDQVFSVPQFGLQTGVHSLNIFQECFANRVVDRLVTLPEVESREDKLMSKLREMLAFMCERTLADSIANRHLLDDSAVLDETSAVPLIEQDTHIGAIRWMEEHAGLSQGAIADLVGVSRQTVQNWTKGETIRDENRQRLLAVWDVLQRVQRRRSSEDALKTWLDTPLSPDGRTPRQLLVNNEIGRVRALSLSVSSAQAISSPAWLRESPPDPWTRRQRHRRERIVRDEPEMDNDQNPDSEYD